MKDVKLIEDRLIRLKEQAKELPSLPGCYLMKSSSSKVIYVGKAKDLKKRVSQYFVKDFTDDIKTMSLVLEIASFDHEICETEAQALIKENQLIKKYRPKYNLRLKDDKRYPSITLDLNDSFPRINYERRPRVKKGVKIFGPFAFGHNLKEVLDGLNNSLKLRTCSNSEFKRRVTPCLRYQMNMCHAPCVSKISSEDYKKIVDLVIDFFRGNGSGIFDFLNQQMSSYAENEQFEYALKIRDELNAIKKFLTWFEQGDKNNEGQYLNYDIVTFLKDQGNAVLHISIIRDRILIGSRVFLLQVFKDDEFFFDEITSVLGNYYQNFLDSKPEMIIVDLPTSEKNAITDFLKDCGYQIAIISPLKSYQTIYSMCLNATKIELLNLKNQTQSGNKAMLELQSILDLDNAPKRLECYDIAVWQGKSPTASQVVWESGALKKDDYRHYTLLERVEGNNDFAMLAETLNRRLEHDLLPDVIIVDGGLIQVNVAQKILVERGLNIKVVGIAKERVKNTGSDKRLNVQKTQERLYLYNQKNPIILKKYPELMKVMVLLRNEAHRFARKLHHAHELKRLI